MSFDEVTPRVEHIFRTDDAVGNREDIAPKKSRRRVAYKTKGRKKSKRVEDQRAYFGTDAYDPDYYHEDARDTFVRDTLRNPRADSPQRFRKVKPLRTFSDDDLRSSRKSAIGTRRTMGILSPYQ